MPPEGAGVDGGLAHGRQDGPGHAFGTADVIAIIRNTGAGNTLRSHRLARFPGKVVDADLSNFTCAFEAKLTHWSKSTRAGAISSRR
jgi:hypothetical protein